MLYSYRRASVCANAARRPARCAPRNVGTGYTLTSSGGAGMTHPTHLEAAVVGQILTSVVLGLVK